MAKKDRVVINYGRLLHVASVLHAAAEQAKETIEQLALAHYSEHGPGSSADIAGAVALLEQGMADLDNDPRIARQLAAFRMDAGDREGAREAISAALESHPESEGRADLAAALAGESDIESVEPGA